MITIEQAIEMAGGEAKLKWAVNHSLKRMVDQAKKSGELIHKESFLFNLAACQGQAARNRAENDLLNEKMLDETAAKNAPIHRDDADHHHFSY